MKSPAFSKCYGGNFRQSCMLRFSHKISLASVGGFLGRELREFRRLERVCREQAALASLAIERDALLKVAEDYRMAIASCLSAEPRRNNISGLFRRLFTDQIE